MSKIISGSGEELTSKVPQINGIRPFGSKILVEIINAKEAVQTTLHLPDDTKTDGAPQAYIVALGPSVSSETGLKVGQRIYWTGKGTHVEDPRCETRLRAILEIHNIIAVIDEDGVSNGCCKSEKS